MHVYFNDHELVWVFTFTFDPQNCLSTFKKKKTVVSGAYQNLGEHILHHEQNCDRSSFQHLLYYHANVLSPVSDQDLPSHMQAKTYRKSSLPSRRNIHPPAFPCSALLPANQFGNSALFSSSYLPQLLEFWIGFKPPISSAICMQNG